MEGSSKPNTPEEGTDRETDPKRGHDEPATANDHQQGYGTNQDPGTGDNSEEREPATGTNQEHAGTNYKPGTDTETNWYQASTNLEAGTDTETNQYQSGVTNQGHASTNQEPGAGTESNQDYASTNVESGTVPETNQYHTSTNWEPGTGTETNQDNASTNQEPGTDEGTNQDHAQANQESGTDPKTNQDHDHSNLESGTDSETNQDHAHTNQEPGTDPKTNQDHAQTNLEPGTDRKTNQDHVHTSQEPVVAMEISQESTSTSHQPGVTDQDHASNISDHVGSSEDKEAKHEEDGPKRLGSPPGTLEPGVTTEMMDDTRKEGHIYSEGQDISPDDLGAPDMEDEVQEAEEEDEKVRETLIEQYQALVSERDKIHQQNVQLQHKLYEYFRRKKGEESRPETEKHADEQAQRYVKHLATLREMRRKHREEASSQQQQIEELRAKCEKVVSQVDKEWAAFQEQKKKAALNVVKSAGKHTAASFVQEVDQLQSREERKEKEVIQVRLENIKLKNQINRHESTVRSKEELADGLHLIDFEQLKIENQTYNEKIEERNEELTKLKKKITNTVQVLTHLKEKLQFVQAENQEQKEQLMDVEALVAHRRDILTKTKQARDSLRMDNLNLKQKCGLLGNETLLRDFEDSVDTTDELNQRLENLKRRHAELTLSSKGIMKKIEEAKLVFEN